MVKRSHTHVPTDMCDEQPEVFACVCVCVWMKQTYAEQPEVCDCACVMPTCEHRAQGAEREQERRESACCRWTHSEQKWCSSCAAPERAERGGGRSLPYGTNPKPHCFTERHMKTLPHRKRETQAESEKRVILSANIRQINYTVVTPLARLVPP